VRTWLDTSPSGAFVVSRAKINAPLHTSRVFQTLVFGSLEHLVIALELLKAPIMKTIIMNQDIHQPAFIKADASYKTERNRQPPTSPKQVRRFGWTRFIELAVLLSIVIGAVYLISKIVTPQVVTAVSIILGFLILRFIVKVILQVTFTILRWLFWLAVILAILLCVL